ncbi:anti-CBASS protein Acb1 family protein [Sandarakinorhabdus sp. DWP1-3-1]|uniref:anti-CBASS protein Acb1 family protein n=1 Tax=Sandarakinorhabdus sp. DWP1-3-1 TaxID=2804627 RepID=UPI003CF22131
MTRAVAKKPAAVRDGLANVVTGMGTTADKNSHRFYAFRALDQHQAEAAYRSSWLTRKIVDVPPRDMTRSWRDWQAQPDEIETIEREERRLCLKAKLLRALILSRLFGGGALILGVAQGLPSDPLAPGSLRKGGLQFVHVVSRYQLSYDRLDLDPLSPAYGEPVMWRMTGQGSTANIHPSRVIAFRGQRAPEGSSLAVDAFWGDPIMQSIGDAVANADLAQAGFATLINEASQDIIGIPDLMQSVASAEYEALLMRRLALAQLSKSTHRALIKDAAETWEQRQVSWAGMPDVINTYLNVVAGAADIPVTRLLGTSPGGLGSTGAGEERDYLAMIGSQQDSELRPALDRIDDVMLPSLFGTRPADVYWTFAALVQETPKQKIDTEKAAADTLKTYGDGGLVPMDVLAKVAANRLIESGEFPGVEAALEEAAKALGEPAPDDTVDPNAIVGEGNVVPLRRAANDAAPRSLYVHRQLQNAAELIAWAKAQGFDTTVPAFEMHVTIAYSRAPVDWLAMGNASEFGNADGKLVIPEGGARIVEPLGDKGAVVLLFNSWELSWRHGSLREKGASWDFPEYQPHVTITYAGSDVDLSAIEPYRGKLVFGPEIFAEVDDTWSDRLTEA